MTLDREANQLGGGAHVGLAHGIPAMGSRPSLALIPRRWAICLLPFPSGTSCATFGSRTVKLSSLESLALTPVAPVSAHRTSASPLVDGHQGTRRASSAYWPEVFEPWTQELWPCLRTIRLSNIALIRPTTSASTLVSSPGTPRALTSFLSSHGSTYACSAARTWPSCATSPSRSRTACRKRWRRSSTS